MQVDAYHALAALGGAVAPENFRGLNIVIKSMFEYLELQVVKQKARARRKIKQIESMDD